MQLLEDDILDTLGEDENHLGVRDFFIAPPPANELTDEDSGEKDNGGFLDNLTHNQLRSEAEAVLTNNVHVGNPSHYDFSGYSNNRGRLWIDGDLVDPMKKDCAFPGDVANAYKNLTPAKLFEIFTNDEVLTLFVTETRKYGLSKIENNLVASPEEIIAFLGILILSCYSDLPGKKCYWDRRYDIQPDMKNILVSEFMRRDRFFFINRYFAIDPNDRVFKLLKSYSEPHSCFHRYFFL